MVARGDANTVRRHGKTARRRHGSGTGRGTRTCSVHGVQSVAEISGRRTQRYARLTRAIRGRRSAVGGARAGTGTSRTGHLCEIRGHILVPRRPALRAVVIRVVSCRWHKEGIVIFRRLGAVRYRTRHHIPWRYSMSRPRLEGVHTRWNAECRKGGCRQFGLERSEQLVLVRPLEVGALVLVADPLADRARQSWPDVVECVE